MKKVFLFLVLVLLCSCGKESFDLEKQTNKIEDAARTKALNSFEIFNSGTSGYKLTFAWSGIIVPYYLEIWDEYGKFHQHLRLNNGMYETSVVVPDYGTFKIVFTYRDESTGQTVEKMVYYRYTSQGGFITDKWEEKCSHDFTGFSPYGSFRLENDRAYFDLTFTGDYIATIGSSGFGNQQNLNWSGSPIRKTIELPLIGSDSQELRIYTVGCTKGQSKCSNYLSFKFSRNGAQSGSFNFIESR